MQYEHPKQLPAHELVGPYNSEKNRETHEEKGKLPFYIIGSPTESLEFFGIRHTQDAESPQAQLLAEHFDTFLTANPNAHIFIEGMHGMDEEYLSDLADELTSEKEAVERYGESGMALFRWKQERDKNPQLKLSSPEASNQDIAEALESRGHSKEAIISYLTARDLQGFITFKGDKDLHVAMAKFLYTMREDAGLPWTTSMPGSEEIKRLHSEDTKEFKRLVEEMMEEHLQGFSRYLNEHQIDLDIQLSDLLEAKPHGVLHSTMSHITDPMNFKGIDSPVNGVAADWNRERDIFLTKKVEESLANGESPFIVFGSSHAIATEDAMNELMKRYKKNEA
jgi:hypothetical protein